MYDKPVKWIHFGLQESSLINSDIYSRGFNAAVPPPVKHRAGTAGSSDAIRGVICFAVSQRGVGKKPWFQALLSPECFLCLFLSF